MTLHLLIDMQIHMKTNVLKTMVCILNRAWAKDFLIPFLQKRTCADLHARCPELLLHMGKIIGSTCKNC